MTIIGMRKVSYIISGVLVAVSVVAILLWGLKLGIDFTGGALLEVEYNEVRPSHDQLVGAIQPLNLGNIVIQPSDERGVLIRMKDLDESGHQEVVAAISRLG